MINRRALCLVIMRFRFAQLAVPIECARTGVYYMRARINCELCCREGNACAGRRARAVAAF